MPRPQWRILASLIWEAWPAWGILLGLGAALIFGRFLTAKPEDAVLYGGMALEVFGVILVIYDMNQTTKQFGRPSPVSQTLDWFGRLPAIFGHTRRVGGAWTPKSVSRACFPGGSVFSNDGITTEDRLEALERNLAILGSEVDSKIKSLRGEVAATKERQDRELRAIRESQDSLRNLTTDVAIGNPHLELVGLAWLLVGIFATNTPMGFARQLSKISPWF